MPFSDEIKEEDVALLQDMFGIPRAEAISRLKANSNNVETATNEFLDDPKSTKYRWDESHFNTDREGETNETGITFNIQGADGLPSVSHVNSAAPTRPPSRTNNRSPLGPTNATQEDADLARAIAESAAESGIPPQEVGVIDHQATAKHFGPANRSEYDSEVWAMVTTKATVEAEAADPPPSNRKRDADAPAFLRQTKEHRLGALLTIYSKIPMTRNFLLRCGRPSPMYGHNSEWWKGKPILRQDVLAKMARGEEIWGEDAHPEFVDELHRLVAFLDKSERSYANVDNLAETKAIDESFGSWMPDVEDRLFQALQDIGLNSPDCGIEDMTTTGKIISVVSPSTDQSEPDKQNEEEDTTAFLFLDVVLDSESYLWVSTMYDALDHFLWSSALSLDYTLPNDAKTAILLKPAEVLTLRFGGTGLDKPCDIPAVFYADRYMNTRKELALHFQTQIRGIKTTLKKLACIEEERANCTGQLCHFNIQGLNHAHNIHDCCTKMIEYAEHLLEWQKKDAQWCQFQDQWQKDIPYSMEDLRLLHTWSGPTSFTSDENANRKGWEHIIQVCKDKMEDVRRTLAECEQTRKELNGYLDVVRKRLTCQEDEVDNDLFVFRPDAGAYHPEYWNPSTKYLLRGVATTPEVAYVCVRGMEDSSNPEEHLTARDQWWKVGYVKSDASPIKSEKVTPDDVLHAAGTESKHPILVYASEAALNQEPIPLSDALNMFIRADNRSFQQELAQEENLRETQNQNQEVQMQDQPIVEVTAAALSQIPSETKGKRKHSIGSSVATNGSIRSDLADVELTFDEHGQCDDNHSDTNTVSSHKMPEMSERKVGVNPFLARPERPAQNNPDTMDIDTEHRLGHG
ncbi:hypothetical protein NUW58_g3956 [Xylaria curta]|uniref:Uncharacterized protein n=1 Tax=Xylaria curta TaxID=42375 RepID=A0ACC1PA06_9PEZI|nr:hypothetical protein NUW58_g3956 [Xylaria curta]